MSGKRLRTLEARRRRRARDKAYKAATRGAEREAEREARRDVRRETELVRKKHALVVEYMRMKTAEGDWHGVADAAMDLREIEAAYPALFVEQDRKGWPRL